MEFPVYRKYPNDLAFFKITDPSHFEELKITGKHVELYLFEAKILPDRNFIKDMLEMHGGHWVESNEAEFLKYRGML